MPRLDIKQNPPLPPFVLVDTSVALSAFFSGHPRHNIALQFLHYAAAEMQAGSTQLLASDLLVTEAAHVIVRTGLEADVRQNVYPSARQAYVAVQGSDRGFGWQQLVKREPLAIQPHLTEVRRFHQALVGVPVLVLQPKEILDPGFQISNRAIELMDRHSLLSADAYHFAVAQAIGCDTVVSLDSDWLRAETDFMVIGDL